MSNLKKVAKRRNKRLNHGLRQAKTGGRIEYRSTQDYVPGYFETVLEWISAL